MMRLTDEQIDAALTDLPGWTRVGEGLNRTYRFADFVAAFAWMTRVALLAEKADHHPEWSNVYNRVEVRVTTHDAGGITVKDIALAKAIDA